MTLPRSKGGIILPFSWKGDFPDHSSQEAAVAKGLAPDAMSRKPYVCARCDRDLFGYVKDGKDAPLVCAECVEELEAEAQGYEEDGVPVGNRKPGYDYVRGGVAAPRK